MKKGLLSILFAISMSQNVIAQTRPETRSEAKSTEEVPVTENPAVAETSATNSLGIQILPTEDPPAAEGLAAAEKANATSSPPEGALDFRLNQNRRTGLLGELPPNFSSAKIELSQSSADRRWNFESGATYTEFEEAPWVRDETRISYRDPDRGWIATAGDFATSFRGFQHSALVAGLSLRKGTAVTSDEISHRRSTYELWIQNEATVEIFVDGRLFVQLRRAPGILDLRSYALLRNRKDVRVRVRDDFGQEQVHHFDLFAESDILPAGTHDFAYEAGYFLKNETGDRAYDGQAAMSSLSHRWGWNERLTFGANYQNYEYRHLFGGEVSTIQDLGLFAVDASGTEVAGTQGYGYRGSWKKAFEKSLIVTELIAEERSEFFVPVRPEGTVLERYRRKADFSLSRPVGDRSLIGGGVSREEGFGLIPRRELLRLDAAYFAASNWTVEGTAYTEPRQSPEHGFRLSFSWQESPKALSISGFHDGGPRFSNLRVERPERGDSRDAFLRVNAQREGVRNDEVDLKSAFWNERARLRLQSFERKIPGQEFSQGSLGVDTSFRWGQGFQVQTPP